MKLASLSYLALQGSGVLALARRVRSGGVILCYHNVVRDDAPNDPLGLHLPLARFERQLQWLAGNYDLVSLGDFAARRSRGDSLRGAAALTFDDGYAGVFQHAWPLLRDRRAPATVFVVAHAPAAAEPFWWDHPDLPPDAPDGERRRWLTSLRGDRRAILESVGARNGARRVPPDRFPASWAAIAAAAGEGLSLGVHSATHRALPTLDGSELRVEIVESRDLLQQHSGVRAEFFAYPYGLWNERAREMVRSAGYRAAFSLDHSGGGSDPWTLPRVNIPSGIEDSAFEAWASGVRLRAPGRRS